MLKVLTFIGTIGLLLLTLQPSKADHKPSHSSGGSLPALEARVEVLEELVANLSVPVVAVTVDCAAGDTISDALSQNPSAVPLIITMVGTCTEDPVEISRDAVTIQGDSLTGTGEPVDTLVGGFNILGSDRIIFKNLVLRDGSDFGIFANRASSVTIDNVTISGFSNAGIVIARHSFARIDNSDVTSSAVGSSGAAVFATDGSSIRVANSNFVSTDGSEFGAPAVGIFRMSHARIDGGDTIQNTSTSTDPVSALAINVGDSSDLRIQNTGNTVTGNIVLAANCGADFRGLELIGQLALFRSVSAQLRNTSVDGNITLVSKSSAQLFNSSTVSESVTVDLQSLLEAPFGAVTGTVTCTRDSAVAGGVVGGAGCNAL